MYNSKKRCYQKRGISLIALIITIIVIIILAAIVIGVAMSTPESANKAKFLGDISEIQQDVAIKRAQNLTPSINNEEIDMNTGFTKVFIRKTPGGSREDGWVVNLDNINVKNSTLGNGYNGVSEGSEIVFGEDAPDVYVYDSNGEVYYAKGIRENGSKVYSINYSTNEPENSSIWNFDESTGTIIGYKGGDVTELVVPAFIGGDRVNSIKGDSVGFTGILQGKNIQILTVSNGITEIGDFAFYSSKSVTRVNLPNSVTTLGVCAFSTCLNLTSINLPDSITTIKSTALGTCPKLTSIKIPSGTSIIGPYAFYGTGITSITIPNTVTTIQASAFSGCRSLKSVVIPDSVTDIGDNTFNTCISLEAISIPSGVKSLKTAVFSDCSSLKSVVISEGVTSIVNYAFRGCTSLTSLNIPSTVTSIANYSFYQCSNITEININKAEVSLGGTPPWGATNAHVNWKI
jgi:type II secretory pathway pseudopilin PulG